MMKKNKKILITILLIMEIVMVNLTYQSFLHKEINKEENKIEKKQFAMYIEENDEYVEYEGDSLFPKDYYVNKDLSNCVDEKGNEVKDAISSLGSSVTVTSNKTIYCTLYFDKNEILEFLRSKDKNGVLSSDIVGDMYRYQGLYTDDIRNYICLGDNCCKTEKCSADSNDDMYRIIGVTDTGEIKVIKKTALTDGVKWWSDIGTDIKWPQSLIYQKLNGKSENSTTPNLSDINSYYYSLDSKLKELIVINHSWLYGDDTKYSSYDGDKIYGVESGSSEAVYYNKEDVYGSPSGKYIWNEKIEAPIGLMYFSDYYYAYKTNAEDAGKPNNKENAKNSWIYLDNNESSHPVDAHNSEWTITRYGYFPYGNYYTSGVISPNGIVEGSSFFVLQIVRPVFYLTSDLSLIGEGTLTEPFEIDYEKTGVDIINSEPTNLSNEETGGMYRFQGNYEDVDNNYVCFGTSDRNNCLNDTEHFLYRIIGIYNDGEMKLIKKEALSNITQWNPNALDNIEWPDSKIFKAINNEGFLNNEKYLPKSDDINWSNKIILKNWLYGDLVTANINGTNQIGTEIYKSETGQKPAFWYKKEEKNPENVNIKCALATQGSLTGTEICYSEKLENWNKKIEAKIGLMYLHDYYLALNDNANCSAVSSTKLECLNNWINLSHNDGIGVDNITEPPPSKHEWTMTRNGLLTYIGAYYIDYFNGETGLTTTGALDWNISTRPVFYIDKNSVFKGKGTLKYPYIIVN